MELTINPFDPASIQAAYDALKLYAENLETKQERLVEHAVTSGAKVANQVYAMFPGDHGFASATAYTKGKEGYIEATAPAGENGSEIGFIEFGTGIHHPEWDNEGMPYTPPEHGTFGQGQGENPGWWYYNGRMTDGRHPAQAMTAARQGMIETVLDDAREVFRT